MVKALVCNCLYISFCQTTLSAQLDSVQRQMHDQSQHQQAAIETAASETRQQLEARARQWQQDYRGDVERVVGELKNAVKQGTISAFICFVFVIVFVLYMLLYNIYCIHNIYSP